MSSLSFRVLMAGLAGVLAWMLLEPSAPRNAADQSFGGWEAVFTIVLGALIGLVVGGLEGYAHGTKKAVWTGIGLGAFLGMVGISLGHGIGGGLVQGIFHGSGVFIDPSTPLVEKIIARMLALAPMGLALGAGIGLSTWRIERVRNGAIGGLIGGAVTGALFDVIGAALGPLILNLRPGANETGGVSRAVMALLLGMFVALFIGLVDRIARSAWVRLSLGKNEGREWPIYSGQTVIGRSEQANVPLFGDPGIAPTHAFITREGPNEYVLSDAGSGSPTMLNGQPISRALLLPGAMITVGGTSLEFLMKTGHAPMPSPEAWIGQSYPVGGQPQGYPQPGPQQPQGVSQQPYGQTGAMAPGQVMSQGPMGPVTVQQQPYGGMPTQAYPAGGMQPTVAAPAFGCALVALDGPLAGQRFEIRQPIELGRESQFLPMSYDTMASRRHASLTPAPGGAQLTDMNSTNGSFVNGQRVPAAMVKMGDTVRIGQTSFRVEA